MEKKLDFFGDFAIKCRGGWNKQPINPPDIILQDEKIFRASVLEKKYVISCNQL